MAKQPKLSPPSEGADEDAWLDYLFRHVAEHPARSLSVAEEVVKRFPTSIYARVYLTQAALHARMPAVAQRELKRLRRKVKEEAVFGLLEALALVLEGKPRRGLARLRATGLSMQNFDWLRELPIRSHTSLRDLGPTIEDLLDPPESHPPSTPRRSSTRPSSVGPRSSTRTRRKPEATQHDQVVPRADAEPASEPTAALFELPTFAPRLHLRVKLPAFETLAAFNRPTTQLDAHDSACFRLRGQHAELTLFEGFDELLCLPTLRGVEKYWFQVETARKVLKHFKGRVLLADEVGLGKTIEAGMVLKEYVLRGMVERVLVLTPAALVGQWHEEMQTKLGLEFVTTRSPELRLDPEGFWRCSRVIASIATARRKEHMTRLVDGPPWDMVIVDEAHHLKNRGSQNYALVDQLQKRFLLLLSATPVQNSLVELYNLLTLLKPGIFETERDFRAAYMTRGRPRTPQNRQQLRSLMRDVMIRNTRALVDVRLPARHALTLRPTPDLEEAGCYAGLSELVHRVSPHAKPQDRLAYKHLLAAAGSSPRAAAGALRRLIERGRHAHEPEVEALAERYAAIGDGCKVRALFELLDKNRDEKLMVFSQHRDTLDHLAEQLRRRAISLSLFHGSLSGSEKDEAIAEFRREGGSRVLLSSEAGGEGRNVQFCNTLVNFDLPWNPMAIEQRIGRLHRIGQTREVFVFNIAATGTIEDALLTILDEKLDMFELVVGEIGAILGELDDDGDFADTVYSAWVSASAEERLDSLAPLGARMIAARERYDEIKQFDEELFGDELEAGG